MLKVKIPDYDKIPLWKQRQVVKEFSDIVAFDSAVNEVCIEFRTSIKHDVDTYSISYTFKINVEAWNHKEEIREEATERLDKQFGDAFVVSAHGVPGPVEKTLKRRYFKEKEDIIKRLMSVLEADYKLLPTKSTPEHKAYSGGWTRPQAEFFQAFPCLRQQVDCPHGECKSRSHGTMESTIIHLNDGHGWTREEIADWIRLLDAEGVIDSKAKEVK